MTEFSFLNYPFKQSILWTVIERQCGTNLNYFHKKINNKRDKFFSDVYTVYVNSFTLLVDKCNTFLMFSC